MSAWGTNSYLIWKRGPRGRSFLALSFKQKILLEVVILLCLNQGRITFHSCGLTEFRYACSYTHPFTVVFGGFRFSPSIELGIYSDPRQGNAQCRAHSFYETLFGRTHVDLMPVALLKHEFIYTLICFWPNSSRRLRLNHLCVSRAFIRCYWLHIVLSLSRLELRYVRYLACFFLSHLVSIVSFTVDIAHIDSFLTVTRVLSHAKRRSYCKASGTAVYSQPENVYNIRCLYMGSVWSSTVRI